MLDPGHGERRQPRHLASGLAPPAGAKKAGGRVTQATVCGGAGLTHAHQPG